MNLKLCAAAVGMRNFAGELRRPQPGTRAHSPIPPGRKIDWAELNSSGLSDLKLLGAGEFCEVYEGHLHDVNMPVAIWCFCPTTSVSEMNIQSRKQGRENRVPFVCFIVNEIL